MAKVHFPVFAQTPKTFTAVVTSAISNLDSDSPGGTMELATAGDDGAIVTNLTAMPRASVPEGAIYVFLSKDGGTTKRVMRSAKLDQHVAAATEPAPVIDFGLTETDPLRLEAGDQLYVGCSVPAAGGISFVAQASDN